MQTILPFNKDIILSQPIEDENDLANVIVELRKAVGHLLKENEDLRYRCDSLDQEMIRLQRPQYRIEPALRGITSPTIESSPTWFEADYASSLSSMTATEMRDKIDSLVHPPLIKSTTEYVD